jgi:hypothetical protein
MEQLGGMSMPPHCDTLDGPIVKAAKMALAKGNVNLILSWVPKKAEGKLKKAFEKTLRVRKLGKQARDLATTGSSKLQCVCTEKEKAHPTLD